MINRGIWKTFTIAAFITSNLQGIAIEQLKAMSDDDLAMATAPSGSGSNRVGSPVSRTRRCRRKLPVSGFITPCGAGRNRK